MSHHYSRLASVEEKRNMRNATRIMVITLVSIILLVFFGIPVLGRFAGFISEIAKGDKPIVNNDTTPPAPPRIDILPKFTNQTSLNISGQSEVGAIIKLNINGRESEIALDGEGKFSKEISLIDGENKIDAKTVDSAGNESNSTQQFSITLDKENPSIEITSPANGANFFGTKQQQIQIIGKTELGANLYINSRFVNVNSDGSFKFDVKLGEGENKFNIKSTDQAENFSEMDLVVNFTL